MEQYGDRLVCVRYRYDEKRRMRLETVELIEEESPWTPAGVGAVYLVRIDYDETGLRERVNRSGCSTFAYYGMYAILFPMMGGGLVAQGLRLVRVPDSYAIPLGVTLAAAGSLYLFLGNRRLEMRERVDRESDIAER